MRIGRIQMVALGVVASGALLLGACGSDDKKDESTGTTQEASTGTSAQSGTDAQTVKFDTTIQTQLKEVGCYTGAVDGIIGPETDAAILAFQHAEGLEADGELGPETESALNAAVAAKRTVCGSSSGTTVAPTTTTAASGEPPCTATAVSVVLAQGDTIDSYVCSDGYAGLAWTRGGTTEQAVLVAKGNAWTIADPSPCGAASAGISPQVLEVGCKA